MDAERLDLEAIKAREQAATPGPWYVLIPPSEPGFRKPLDFFVTMVPAAEYEDWPQAIGRTLRERDTEFIAHARQDIPALIAALEWACAEIERLRRELRPYGDPHATLMQEVVRLIAQSQEGEAPNSSG